MTNKKSEIKIKPVLRMVFWNVYSPPIKKLVAVKEIAEMICEFLLQFIIGLVDWLL